MPNNVQRFILGTLLQYSMLRLTAAIFLALSCVPAAIPAVEAEPPRKYIGKPVSLDLKGSPIRGALKVIETASGKKITVPRNFDLDRPVTLKTEAIPWDKALELLLKPNGYGFKIRASQIEVNATAQGQPDSDYSLSPQWKQREYERRRKAQQAERARKLKELKALKLEIVKVQKNVDWNNRQYCTLTYPIEKTLQSYQKRLRCLKQRATVQKKVIRGISPFSPDQKRGIAAQKTKSGAARAISPFKPGQTKGIQAE